MKGKLIDSSQKMFLFFAKLCQCVHSDQNISFQRIVLKMDYFIITVRECCAQAVVVAQVVEQSLTIPEIRSSSPFIGKFYLLSTVLNIALKDGTQGSVIP